MKTRCNTTIIATLTRQFFGHTASQFLRLTALLFLMVSVSNPLHATTSASDRVKEYQIKGLFLYNFANFVIWPDKAFESFNSGLKMCLVGNVPFGGFLDTVDGTLIGDRVLQVIRAEDETDPDVESGCHIVFVGINKRDTLSLFFDNLNHLFVLSVGDKPRFANDWGTVNIHRVKDGARVEINLKKAYKNGLMISSDLLNIAKIVER